MEFPDRSDVDGLIDPQPLPGFARVRYEPRTERLDDPVGAARAELDALDLDDGAGGFDDGNGGSLAQGEYSYGVFQVEIE